MALFSAIMFVVNVYCIGLRWDQPDLLMVGNAVGAAFMLFIFLAETSDY